MREKGVKVDDTFCLDGRYAKSSGRKTRGLACISRTYTRRARKQAMAM